MVRLLLFCALVTCAGTANLPQDGTHIYYWNQVLPADRWLLMPYPYLPVYHPNIHYNNNLVPSYYVPDMTQTKREMCKPLSLRKCVREAELCLDLGISLRDSFSTYTSVVNCAGKNGIGVFDLIAANSPTKTNAEVLRDAGADQKTATAIFRCVLNSLGFAKNDVLDIGRVKTVLRPIITQSVQKPDQREATLAALNTCPQPDIDGIRGYVICISNACIKGR